MSAQITLPHSDWPDVDQAGSAIEPYYLINRGALCSFDIHVWPAFHVPFDIGLDRSAERSCGARRMAESAALLVDAVTVSFRVAETLVPTGAISEAFRGDTLVIFAAKTGSDRNRAMRK